MLTQLLTVTLLTLTATAQDRLGADPGGEAFGDDDSERVLHIDLEGPEGVVGGDRVRDGDWPDAAGIVFNERSVGCTGTLIHPRVVLTAAHCVDGYVSHVVLDSTNYYSDDGGLIVAVDEAIPFDRNWDYNGSFDAAVLILAEDVDDIEPRTIAQDCIIDDYLEEGAEVMVVGYGGTVAGTSEQQGWGNSDLNEGQTVVVDPDCENTYGCFPELSPGGEIFAGGDGVDACFGDSGGPLYLLTDEGDYLVGITSRGNSGACGSGTLYVRPDAIIEWIEETADVELRHPPCNLAASYVQPSVRKVPQGRSEVFHLKVLADPEGDTPMLAVHEQPEHGGVAVDGLKITYVAPIDHIGFDNFTVELMDDGDYPYAEPVLVPINIQVVKKGFRPWRACGCSGTGGPMGGLGVIALAGLALLRRRRR